VELVPVAVEPEVVLMGLLASLPGSVAAVAPGGQHIELVEESVFAFLTGDGDCESW
jgi:hypothetical protein